MKQILTIALCLVALEVADARRYSRRQMSRRDMDFSGSESGYFDLPVNRDATCARSCDESPNMDTVNWEEEAPCWCDGLCVMWDDCCQDAEELCNDEWEPMGSGMF